MESTRPIRALVRGLDALAVLNTRDGATVTEIAQQIRLPRTTVYRILETLCEGGFVARDPADERYRITIRVRGLSRGFDDEAWVREAAEPLVLELGREVLWPVALATRRGAVMMVRASSDRESPLALQRRFAGMRLPLLDTASGRAHLAACAEGERAQLLAGLVRQPGAGSTPRDLVEREVEAIRARGHALIEHADGAAEIAVPVPLESTSPAALSLRFESTVLPADLAEERYLPALRAGAARLAESFGQRAAAVAPAPAAIS